MFPEQLWPRNHKFILTFKHFIQRFILLSLWLFLCPCCTFTVPRLASFLHVVYCVFTLLTEQNGLWSALLFSMWPTDTFGLCRTGLFGLFLSRPIVHYHCWTCQSTQRVDRGDRWMNECSSHFHFVILSSCVMTFSYCLIALVEELHQQHLIFLL